MSVWLLVVAAFVVVHLVLWAMCVGAADMDRRLGVEDNPRWDDRYRRHIVERRTWKDVA